jgi:hypothetical protein
MFQWIFNDINVKIIYCELIGLLDFPQLLSYLRWDPTAGIKQCFFRNNISELIQSQSEDSASLLRIFTTLDRALINFFVNAL